MIEIENLEVVDTLQESERFVVQTVSYEGVAAVLKRAKTTKMALNLAHELQAYQIYGQITQESDCPFGIASVLAAGDDWLLLSFLRGKPMDELVALDSRRAFYDQAAAIMAFCDDKAGITVNGSRMPMSKAVVEEQGERMAGARSRLVMLDRFGVGHMKDSLKAAADFCQAHLGGLQTCFVNPDLTLSHIMVNGEHLAIFDFENARLSGARFSDLINLVTKVWFIDGDQQQALDFYDAFWQRHGQSPAIYGLQLKTLILQRCIGFTDELLTEPNQYHNTHHTMTPNFARNIAAVLEWAESFD